MEFKLKSFEESNNSIENNNISQNMEENTISDFVKASPLCNCNKCNPNGVCLFGASEFNLDAESTYISEAQRSELSDPKSPQSAPTSVAYKKRNIDKSVLKAILTYFRKKMWKNPEVQTYHPEIVFQAQLILERLEKNVKKVNNHKKLLQNFLFDAPFNPYLLTLGIKSLEDKIEMMKKGHFRKTILKHNRIHYLDSYLGYYTRLVIRK
jgi:hypothetical protein